MLLGLGTPSPVPAPMPCGSLSRPGLVLERLICYFPGLAPECVRGQGWREKGEGGDQGERGGGFERDKPREFSVRRKLGGVMREAGLVAVLRQSSSAVQSGNEYAGEEWYQKIFSDGKFGSLESSGFQEIA